MALVAMRRDLGSRFILNHFSAIGHIGSAENWTWDYKRLSKPPRALPRYLASRRRYGVIEVQPVAIPQGPDLDPLAGSLGVDDDEWGFLSTGRYTIALSGHSALDLLDVIHASLALLRQTVDDDDLMLIPVEAEDIPETRVITSESFDALARRRLPMHSAQTAPLIAFSLSVNYGLHFDDYLWRLCDLLLKRVAHARAALYFRSAIRHVFLQSGPVDDYHASFEEMPSRIREQAAIESSITDCLKAVETIYGGPLSGKANRISMRLTELGVDPTEICGFSRPPYTQDTVLKKVLDLRDARNSRAAHGTSADERLNSLYDLCDFQHLTSLLLWRAIAKCDERLLKNETFRPAVEFAEELMTPEMQRKLPKNIVRTD
jgi:hypothetical protein